MLFLVLVTSTKHYWVISAERRRPPVFNLTNVRNMTHISDIALILSEK
jgi:hypothetical protein